MSFDTYLMVRNKGLAPIEGLTLFGVSTSRSESGMIGEFGTGSKQAVALMLRCGIKPILYVGSLRMEFDSVPMNVDDGLGVKSYNRVVVKYSGSQEGRSRSGTEKLGFTCETGVADWTELPMALRELVSNAIDRQTREAQPNPEISIVSEAAPKRGHTTWYIPVSDEVLRYFRQIPQRFLHFTEKGNLSVKIMRKGGRNPSGSERAVIYKKGVLVREWDGDELPSLFDYNLGSELTLDESRKVDNWAIRGAVSRCLADAPADVLAVIMRSMGQGKVYWEHTLEGYNLDGQYVEQSTVETRAGQWKAAWKEVFGEKGVVVGPNPHLAGMVAGKGLKPVIVPSAGWRQAMKRYSVPTDETVLTQAEHEGKTEGDPHPDHVEAVDRIWGLLEGLGMTMGRDKPPVKGFQAVMEGETIRNGYWREGTVFLHYGLVPGNSVNLMKVALEEVVHHVTQAEDNSRDIQDFAFRLAAELAFRNDVRGTA